MNILASNSVPVDIKRKRAESASPELSPGIGLEILWSSGEQVFFDSNLLRGNCPCAECLEKRRATTPETTAAETKKAVGLRVISATAAQATNLTAVWAIGNYAIGIRWGDRHAAGIYSYTLLRELASKVL